MPKVYVLFWFDVEDCTVPQSDDCAKRLCQILTKHGVTGTMKLVGQKARMLEQRVRYDVIDALQLHDIGFHSNWHGLRPQIAEYLAPLGMEDGAAEFERREGPGLEDVKRIFGAPIVTYGQPGSNWAPQAFSVLSQWNIPTYVSGFGYIGVDCQPFYLGGLLCTSHMYGQRLDGQEQRHLMGLNFELGGPGELEKHQAQFTQSLEQLRDTGGLISIINHPCTLVLEEWFSTYMKPRERIEAGYQHFEDFVQWALSHPNVEAIGASRLPELYADQALGRHFGAADLLALATALSDEINYVRLGPVTLSAAEAFRLLLEAFVLHADRRGTTERVPYAPLAGPTVIGPAPPRAFALAYDQFERIARRLLQQVRETPAVPAQVQVNNVAVDAASYLAAVARVLAGMLRGDATPATVEIKPAARRFEDTVDPNAAASAARSAMMKPGFEAPGLYELAKLLAWTVKPAVLQTQ
jgi:hypothetical protein